jgi:hypothetical protein
MVQIVLSLFAYNDNESCQRLGMLMIDVMMIIHVSNDFFPL